MRGHTRPMATKTDFTEQEWKALQGAVTGAGLWVASVDRGFLDTFKEASALSHHLRDAHTRATVRWSGTSPAVPNGPSG